jgi:hypothetical protein
MRRNMTVLYGIGAFDLLSIIGYAGYVCLSR